MPRSDRIKRILDWAQAAKYILKTLNLIKRAPHGALLF